MAFMMPAALRKRAEFGMNSFKLILVYGEIFKLSKVATAGAVRDLFGGSVGK